MSWSFTRKLASRRIAKSKAATSSRGRRVLFETLEDRRLLSWTGGFTPAQVSCAYGIDQIQYGSTVGNGAGQTIAIIDTGDDSAFVYTGDPDFNTNDLYQFDQAFGLADPPSFKVVGQDGGSRPGYPSGGNPVDTGETAMDVEWSHAIAPQANIVLIETTHGFGTASTDADFAQAVQIAATQARRSSR